MFPSLRFELEVLSWEAVQRVNCEMKLTSAFWKRLADAHQTRQIVNVKVICFFFIITTRYYTPVHEEKIPLQSGWMLPCKGSLILGDFIIRKGLQGNVAVY